MPDHIMRTHVQLINLRLDQVVPEYGHVFLRVKLIFPWIFSGRNKNQRLTTILELLNPIPAPQNALLKLIDAVVLLFRFLYVFRGDGHKRLGQGVEVQKNLVP